MRSRDFAAKRMSMGLTQADVGRIMGVQVCAVSRWENEATPLPQYAKTIIDLLSRHKNPKEYRPPR